MATFKPVVHDITRFSNTTLEEILRFRDGKKNIVDIAGYTGRLEVRTDKGEDPEVTDPILVLTTENGGLIIDSTLGKLTIFVEVLTVDMSGKYDLLLVDPDGKQHKPIAPSKLKVLSSVTSIPE